MERTGRLTRQDFGYSIPVDAPLYPKPPIYYQDAEAIFVLYETDPDAAAAMLPEGLVVPSPAVATAMVVTYPRSTLGMYNEAILALNVLHNGEAALYIPHILVDNDQAMAAGREIWGYPKKIGSISLDHRGEGIVGTVERPKGNRLCTVVVQPESPMQGGPPSPVLSLRVLPSQKEDGSAEIAQLIETRRTEKVHWQWFGRGSVSFGGTSSVDPWSNLPVKKLLGGVYSCADIVLPLGKVVREY